jgi:hypothetical protein
MSAQKMLRDAAKAERDEWGSNESRRTYPISSAIHLAVADWLDTAGADLWAHGPLHCAEGCMECDDDLWMPHVRRALDVARAILGGAS